MSRIALITLTLLPMASPALAATRTPRLSVGGIFVAAATPIQLILALLVLAILLAPVLAGLRRSRLLNAVAKGAPLLALAGALFTLLAGTVGIANSPAVPSLTVLAPGIAEALFLLVLGALAAFSAVVSRELSTAPARA